MPDWRDRLSAKVVEFCALLRTDLGFKIGAGEAIECLRALDLLGVRDRGRVAAMLRALCCGRAEEIAGFDAAFDAFFSSRSPGAAQRSQARRTRPSVDDGPSESVGRVERQPEPESPAQAWQAMLARYSPAAASGETPEIPAEGLDAMRRQADRIIARLRRGRALRWRPQRRGPRFDLRRTLRASLRAGGDVIEPRVLARPPRNPRFVLLIDGSRSMIEHAPRILQLAYAFCTRSRRANAYVFSTQLYDVTRRLRALRSGTRLGVVGEAWGGGTRIGASLTQFVRAHGARLTRDTFAIVVSDGLDAGEIAALRGAMREIARRCAAIGWVNPHADRDGYEPSARGMQAALPYVGVLTSLERLDRLGRLGRGRAHRA